MADTTFQDFTYQSDIQNDLVSKNSQLRSFDDYTDGLGFESQFEGVPAGQIITGGLQIKKKTFSDGSNGIWIGVDADGLAKINVGNSTSYMYWDGTTLGIAGSVVVGGSFTATTITGSTITGSTITGSTLTTATSGQRVVLTSTLAQFYSSANTLIAQTYADGGTNAYLIKGMQTNSNIYLDAGSSGSIAFLFNGTIQFLMNAANNYFAPALAGQKLGNISNQWGEFWHNGDEVYQGMTMPVVYFGLVESGSIVNDNFVPWTVNNIATGRYVISHSLGHTDYAIQVTPKATTVKNITIEASDASDFTVRISNSSEALENNDFFFTVFEYPQ